MTRIPESAIPFGLPPTQRIPISVTVLHHAVTKEFDEWVMRDAVWVMRVTYVNRHVAGQYGFRWDDRYRRWATSNSGEIWPLAEYCDAAALAALDEHDPRWREWWLKHFGKEF